MENGWIPQINTCSAIENTGVLEIQKNISKFDRHMISNGWKEKNRKEQAKYWLHYTIKEEFGKQRYNSLLSEGRLKVMEEDLLRGKTIYQLLDREKV